MDPAQEILHQDNFFSLGYRPHPVLLPKPPLFYPGRRRHNVFRQPKKLAYFASYAAALLPQKEIDTLPSTLGQVVMKLAAYPGEGRPMPESCFGCRSVGSTGGCMACDGRRRYNAANNL